VFQLAFGPPPWLSLELLRNVIQRRLDRGDDRLAQLLDRAFSFSFHVPWVSGAALLVRREAFDTVQGFDEKFFLYFEDIDLCLRLRERFGPVVWAPEVTVLHHRGRSAAKEPGRAARAYRESQRWFWEKHRGRGIAALVRLYQRLRGVASTS
jgi:GT2 family glycosyltransferase